MKGEVVKLEKYRDYSYLEPWYSIRDENNSFSKELRRELDKKHILYGKDVMILAKRDDRDDILVGFYEGHSKFAVVHLTWRQKSECGNYPITTIYDSWIEFKQSMLENHEEWSLRYKI